LEFHSQKLLAYLKWRVEVGKSPRNDILQNQYILSGGPFWKILKLFI
jgi:hypothetical protein